MTENMEEMIQRNVAAWRPRDPRPQSTELKSKRPLPEMTEERAKRYREKLIALGIVTPESLNAPAGFLSRSCVGRLRGSLIERGLLTPGSGE